MKLADYLFEADIRPAAFAERIGVTRQAMWRYVSGDRRPEWGVLERIQAATDGHVTPNDFLSCEAPQRPRAPISGAAA